MSKTFRIGLAGVTTTVLLALGINGLHAQGMFDAKPIKLPWRIAFVRDRNIWTMNADGSGQKLWRQFGNVHNRLSWSPDGKQLAWCRQGEVTYKLPDGGGGGRRIYDLFRAELDSTREGYWRWITFNHGSRSPEFSPDGQRVLYANDLSANIVDAELPDYQIEHSRLDGTDIVRLTRAGAKPGECQGLEPTWSPDGKQVAFIFHKRASNVGEGRKEAPTKPVGLVIAPSSGITASEEELEAQAKKMPGATAPAWSPDGKSIAYLDLRDGGIYVVDAATCSNSRSLVPKADRMIPMQTPVSWSPDSKWLIFSTTDGYIFIADSEGKSRPQRITSGGNDYAPAFSPK